MIETPPHEAQATIWDFYKPRHTHSWNMLVLSWRALENYDEVNVVDDFECEYLWENFILRLWLYRTTIKTLTRLEHVKTAALVALAKFDDCFELEGSNALKAVRDMLEHFDDYAAGVGRGPATRFGELDPWRTITPDRFERGRFVIERATAYEAAIRLRVDANEVSGEFIRWNKSQKSTENMK